MTTNETLRVLDEVRFEREDQDEKWGEQNHPVISGDQTSPWWRREWALELQTIRGDEAAARQEGSLGWDLILLEEVYEALSEEDEIAREAELIQVAAVAVAMVEASRRKRAAR